MPDKMLDPMRRTIARNALKYAAGTAIFCPLCGNIMDCKRTVIVEAGNVTKVLCAPCWDNEIKPRLSPERLDQIEVTDGRLIFAKGK